MLWCSISMGSELSAGLHPAVFRADATAEPGLKLLVALLGLTIPSSVLGPSSLCMGNKGMDWINEF